MKVMVLGLGYVGFTSACCIASQGHEVVGVDPNARKVRDISGGRAPIIEPDLEGMLAEALEAGRLTVDTAIAPGAAGADLALVCVGTPSAADGAHNMGFIADVSRQLAASLAATRAPARSAPLVVAYRSTFRPGTVEELVLPILRAALGDGAGKLVRVVYMPEFLREGTAVADYFGPPKIVVGTADAAPEPVIEALNRRHRGAGLRHQLPRG